MATGRTGPLPGGWLSAISRSKRPSDRSQTAIPPATGTSSRPAISVAGPTGRCSPVPSTR